MSPDPKTARPSGAQAAIGRQVVLPFGKSLSISLSSLKARFLRNLITVASLVLAVAFLAFVLANMAVAGGLLASGDAGLREAVARAGFDVPAGATAVGAGAKERWIAVLSLLVCAVGIVNAQLMAVTERFREIGTMKCLGALDSFILRLFLLEAAMQGIAGAVAGALLGGATALLTGLARFGSPAWSLLSWGGFFAAMGQAALAGLVLCMAGVAYPAWVAARMQPVEAMRAE